jgi:hypothetical protein
MKSLILAAAIHICSEGAVVHRCTVAEALRLGRKLQRLRQQL